MPGDRKKEQLDVVLSGRGHPAVRSTGFDEIRFEHIALPELNIDSIELTADFLGKKLKLPFLVSSMTGGPSAARTINRNLAIGCEALGIAMGVGSQRVAIENDETGGLDRELRHLAPTIPILANIGAAQLVAGFSAPEARRAVDMIGADALIVHLNPLQEAVQENGDRKWSGILAAMADLCRALEVPVVVKEVGYGIAPGVATQLRDAGVAVFDVAGAGGTSWTTVEAERSDNARQKAVAGAFADWGQSTALSLSRLREHFPDLPLIASGGIRSGVDAAKAIRLGADLVGQAAGVLKAATVSPDDVVEHFTVMGEQLRIACFCTGSASLAALRGAALEKPFPDFGSLRA